MSTFTADTFQLPTSCRAAIPFFEESDSLRENAVHWNDLVAAFYLRWNRLLMILLLPLLLPVLLLLPRVLKSLESLFVYCHLFVK